MTLNTKPPLELMIWGGLPGVAACTGTMIRLGVSAAAICRTPETALAPSGEPCAVTGSAIKHAVRSDLHARANGPTFVFNETLKHDDGDRFSL
jgi:hypothetical protein